MTPSPTLIVFLLAAKQQPTLKNSDSLPRARTMAEARWSCDAVIVSSVQSQTGVVAHGQKNLCRTISYAFSLASLHGIKVYEVEKMVAESSI